MINNRIVNGSFESGFLSPFTGTNVSLYSAASHSAPYSARLVGGAVSARLTQVVPVVPGENFEFFVSIAKLGSAVSPPISFVISYLNSSGSVISPPALNITISSGNTPTYWREIYSTTTPAPDTATQARIEIIKNPQLNSADVVVDDVALIAVVMGNTVGDLTVSGNETVQGNLKVEGNTQLNGHLETYSNTSFYGGVNVFSRSVYIDENLSVTGSDIIGRARRIEKASVFALSILLFYHLCERIYIYLHIKINL